MGSSGRKQQITKSSLTGVMPLARMKNLNRSNGMYNQQGGVKWITKIEKR